MALNGAPLAPGIAGRTRDQLRRVQLVFQMADTALNPARTVGHILSRPLQLFHGAQGGELNRRLARLLDLVHLPPSAAGRQPGELSGGQKQRVNLARALAAEPDLILCDEVTSALDTVVGAAILDLMDELRRELGLSTMFISHDLHLVRAVCDDVMVLYAGRTVEAGSRASIGMAPRHLYADLLIASVPELRMGWLDGIPAQAGGPGAAGATARRSGVVRVLPPLPRAPAGPVRHAAGADAPPLERRVHPVPPRRGGAAGTGGLGDRPRHAGQLNRSFSR